MIRILVVEDDLELNQAVCKHLNHNQYEAVGCINPKEAIDYFFEDRYDLIICDIMMPMMDGFEFTELVRGQDKEIPILFMTAKDDFSSKKRGYTLAIDDYLVKPIDLNELLLHIEALLRRAKIINQKKLRVNHLVLDEEEMSAYLDDQLIALTLREFQILFKLLSYPRKTFTRTQLLEEFNGYDNESGLRTVDVHITNLRSKLASCQDIRIETVRGMGYKVVIL